MKFFIQTLFPLLLAAFPCIELYADPMGLARTHMEKQEYYNAITELMRYQYHYPDGPASSSASLLMGKAYYYGRNYYKASDIFQACYEKNKSKPAGEEALFMLGHMRLTMGSPFFAYRTFQEYQYLYKNGPMLEDARAHQCYALALMSDFKSSKDEIAQYTADYPDGKYYRELTELDARINKETERPRKSMWTSLIGSVFLPGFGHFYTGNYSTGLFSLMTNATLIYLAYDGYRDNDKFQMIFFAFVELSFYQYSLISSIGNIHDYNSPRGFKKQLRLKIEKKF